MAQKPAFGALRKAKPAAEVNTAAEPSAAAVEPKPTARIQTSIRLQPAMWAALNDLATRKRMESGRRVTVHDLLIEGGLHIFAVNGIKLSK